jgi:hypothetical protein
MVGARALAPSDRLGVEVREMGLCVFCFRPETDVRAWCADNPGKGCTYGLAHEYPMRVAAPKPRAVDAKLCTRCGLHPRNPASATNGCEHAYP